MKAIQRIIVLALAAFVLPGILNDLIMSPVIWVSSHCELLYLAIYSVFQPPQLSPCCGTSADVAHTEKKEFGI
jgi:hypothetical protein